MKKLLNISNTLMMLAVWACLLMSSVYAQAGEPVKDPLGKPDIWKQLEQNPKNDMLWSKYFGKDLFELTKEEGLNFKVWRGQLVAVVEGGAPNKKFDSPEDLAALHKLTDNIAKNFFLIEDFFSAEYKKLGAEYITYATKNPSGSYNKIQWVEEHEKKLKELRLTASK